MNLLLCMLSGVFNLLGYKEHTKDIEKAKEYFLKGS